MTHTATETDIARPVVEHLRSLYGEESVCTELPYGMLVLDIVCNPVESASEPVFAFEAKKRDYKTLYEQCRRLQGIADTVTAVVQKPHKQSSQGYSEFRTTCMRDGIGLILVTGNTWHQELEPLTNMNAQTSELLKAIHKYRCGHNDNEAGSKAAKTSDDSIAVAAIEKYLDEWGEVEYGKVYSSVDGLPASWRTSKGGIPGKIQKMVDGERFSRGVVARESRGIRRLVKA